MVTHSVGFGGDSVEGSGKFPVYIPIQLSLSQKLHRVGHYYKNLLTLHIARVPKIQGTMAPG